MAGPWLSISLGLTVGLRILVDDCGWSLVEYLSGIDSQVKFGLLVNCGWSVVEYLSGIDS